jgi:hypothetical protein
LLKKGASRYAHTNRGNLMGFLDAFKASAGRPGSATAIGFDFPAIVARFRRYARH